MEYPDLPTYKCEGCGDEQLILVAGKYCSKCAIEKGLIDDYLQIKEKGKL